MTRPIGASLRQHSRTGLTRRKEAQTHTRRTRIDEHPPALRSLIDAAAVRVSKMSAYQAQFRPSDSSTGRLRPAISRRAECTPSNFQGNCAPGIVLHQSPTCQRRPKYPAMNKMMTTRPTSQMILFTRLLLCGLKI